MADALLRVHPPPRDDSRARIPVRRVYASTFDATRGAIVRVEAGTGVVFQPVDGSAPTTWPVLRRRTVEGIAVAPDGSLHAATLQGLLHVTGPTRPELRKVAGGALCIAVDASGHPAVGTGRGTVWLGDHSPDFNGYQAHGARVEAIDRNGAIVVSGGADAKVVWVDLDTEQATTFSGHVAGISAVVVVDATLALSGSDDGAIKAWGGPERGLLWSTRLENGGPVRALAHNGTHVLATGRDRAIWALCPHTGAVQGLYCGHHRPVADLHALPGGAVWSRGSDRTLRLWSGAPLAERPPFFGHGDGVRAVLVEQGLLTTASRDGTVRRWDLASAAPVGRPFQVSSGAVQVLARHTKDALFFGGTDGTVGIVDHRGKVLHRQALHEGPVTCLARPTPGLLVSGGADGILRTWDATRLTPLAARSDHNGRVRCVTRVDDTLVTGSYDGTLARVSPLGGAVLARFEGHDRPVVGVAYTGQHVVSGSLDGTVRSWTPDGVPVSSAVACPDGVVGVVNVGPGRVVTVTKSGKAALWSTPELSCLAQQDLGVPLDGVGFGRDQAGRPVVVVGDQRGGIHALHTTSGVP